MMISLIGSSWGRPCCFILGAAGVGRRDVELQLIHHEHRAVVLLQQLEFLVM